MTTEKVAEYFELLYSNAEKLWRSEERAWLVSFRSPLEIWAENPTYLMLEIVTYVWAFLIYKHGMHFLHGTLCNGFGNYRVVAWSMVFTVLTSGGLP